jgi:ribosomal protein L11 methyltransferase
MSVRTVFSNLDHATAHALAEIVEAAQALDVVAVGIDEYDENRQLWSVSAYFDQAPANSDINRLAEIAATALDIAPLTWVLEQVPDVNWVQKSLEGLSPVDAGRFFIHGRHDRHLRGLNSIAIELEAGMAFGSGHHGTTKGCLIAFDQLLKQRRFGRILDIGTGTGILAIAAALALKTQIIASDIDPVAVQHAAINAHHNGVGNYVPTFKSTGLNHHIIRAKGPYDLIFANILARPLAAMAWSIGAHAKPGAFVILSGILPDQSIFVERAYRAQGFVVHRRYNIENWITLCLHV